MRWAVDLDLLRDRDLLNGLPHTYGKAIGGRREHLRITYTSDPLALARLEVLVHCDFELLPSNLVAVEIDVPAEIQVNALTILALPCAWCRYPAPRTFQQLGNSWLDEAATVVVLRVPSPVVPTECTYLINLAHPHFKAIRVVRRFKFAFDERLTFESKPTNLVLQRTNRKVSHHRSVNC